MLARTEFTSPTKVAWANYWKHHDTVAVIPERYCYHEWLKTAASLLREPCTAIEIGGFPGSFSVYLKKYCNVDATLIDYFIDQQIMDTLLETNCLTPGSIKAIEEDVFSYLPEATYDLVCSFGFIEHFTDLEHVLRNHIKFLKPGGVLLVTLPNFRGINGLLQAIFDPGNLAIHNLAVMDLPLLRKALSNLGMQDIQAEYYPSTQVWLEHLRSRTFPVRLFIRIVNGSLSVLGKAFGHQSRWLSNSIVILAKSPFEG